MGYTETQRDELRAAIASGALTVRHGEKLVTYRSLEEMRALLAEMERDVAAVPRVRARRVRLSRGY